MLRLQLAVALLVAQPPALEPVLLVPFLVAEQADDQAALVAELLLQVMAGQLRSCHLV